ncbi:hypothetical protein E4Q23_19420 [Candidatus Accumulibacter phosphatis]|jgi:hypothetical protein|uniref:Uncharacterized protein n=1 Tax=Candidatus Accumulibacter phosphatis TaxID=327160 RepID=A0ABX1TZP8_9PROT|nr:hypothetical protein [Candidatus Accumulibacter phosphatis]NMQ29744.1 hypothetical protein [Candidatus Accumulibacter phosphatis]
MRFEDKILLQLGDPAVCKTLFDGTLAERLLAASFGSLDLLAAPYTADPVTVMLGPTAPPQYRGRTRLPDGGLAEFEVDLIGQTHGPSALPAIIEGTVSAMLSPVTGRIATVESSTATMPTLAALDSAASAAELADPVLLERRRRIGLGKAIAGAGLSDGDAALLAGEWLSAAAEEDVAALLEAEAGPAGYARLAMRFAMREPAAPSQRTTRFTAGAIASTLADGSASVLDVLTQARAIQRVIRASGRGTASLGGMEPLVPAPVIWFVPAASFDDDDWPVAVNVAANDRPAARQTRAAAWFATQGIALIGVP